MVLWILHPSLAKINQVRVARDLPPIVPTPSVLVDMARSTQPIFQEVLLVLFQTSQRLPGGLVERVVWLLAQTMMTGSAPTAVN